MRMYHYATNTVQKYNNFLFHQNFKKNFHFGLTFLQINYYFALTFLQKYCFFSLTFLQ